VAETALKPEEKRLDPTTDNNRQNKRLMKIIGVILSVIMVVLTVYVLNVQNQNYRTLSKTSSLFIHSSSEQASYARSYKQQLAETTEKLAVVSAQLDQVSAELATTKGMLSETQGLLASAQTENAKLKNEIMALDSLRNTENVANIPELEAKISTLKKTNVQVSSELENLKRELRAFEADFSNLEEGRSLITLFQNKIRLVKSRMRYLKQEAFFAKVAAQKEKDRIAALNGNSGFVVRGGEPKKAGTNQKGFVDVKIVQ
jgi:chromosome segregation ATPase